MLCQLQQFAVFYIVCNAGLSSVIVADAAAFVFLGAHNLTLFGMD